MRTATIDDLLIWSPRYSRTQIQKLVGDTAEFTALDILHREDITANVQLWTVLRSELIESHILHTFACDVAEYVQSENADPRLTVAIETKRRWIHGNVTDKDLVAARAAAKVAAGSAWASARAAAWTAASSAISFAARAAVESTAFSATEAARLTAESAGAATMEWQIVHLIEMLTEQVFV